MSDLQDLIHKTSIDCIEKGQLMERERIVKLLEDYEWTEIFIPDLIRLIKGETK